MRAVLFLAVFLVQRCCFASDALDTWSLQYTDNRGFWSVTYTSGLFVASGEGGTLVISRDGLNWTEQTADTNQGPLLVASDEVGNFLAVGETRRGGLLAPVILRSSNGISWEEQAIAFYDHQGIASTNLFRDVGRPLAVAFAAGTFVLGTVTERSASLFYSTDQTNWFPAIEPELANPPAKPYYNVLFPAKALGTNSMIAAGSTWSPIRLGTVELSNSGPAWDFQEVHPPGAGYAMSTAYGNGTFVMVGLEMPTFVSTNGRDWTARFVGEPPVFPDPPTPDYLRLNHFVGTSVAFGNGTFVACCGAKDFLVSTNGLWERRPIPSGSSSRSIAYGAGRFVMVGPGGIYASAHVATPGLALRRPHGIQARLEISGEINRHYLLEQSPDLRSWSEIERIHMSLPKTQRTLDASPGRAFYRARLVN